MSNIHTFSELSECQESEQRTTSVRTQSLEESGVGYYDSATSYQTGYIDMNGELKLAPAGPKWRTFLIGCAPCFVEPCGVARRAEYIKSLKSFTVPLSLVQILVFIVSLCLHGFAPPSQNPMLGPPATSLVTLGAKQGYLIQKGAVWRFFTPILLHAGVIHLLLNLLCQWRFGLFLERRWETSRYAIIYVASGIGATLLSCLLSPNRISVGASGALMGLMGAFISDILLNWSTMEPRQRNLLLGQTAFWVILALLLGITPMVDAGAHIGGLFVGFAVGFLVFSHIPKEQRSRILCMVLPSISLAVYLLVGLVSFWTVVKCMPPSF